MRIERSSCYCKEKRKTKNLNDKYNSIICETCFEVISYESKSDTLKGRIKEVKEIKRARPKKRKQLKLL